MQKKNGLRIGLVGAIHPNMPGGDIELFRLVIGRMEALGERYGFDLVSVPDPLRTEEDAEQARRKVDEEQVDFLLLFMPSLPFGRVMLPLAKTKARIGLWSVAEPTAQGVLQLNSFCGLNMLGSIVGNYLRRYDIPFKWFYGMPEEEHFLERLTVTLDALRAIKKLRTSRIGRIGGLANGFENLYFDERDLEKKFGIYLQTRHTVEEIVARARALDESRVLREIEEMKREETRGGGAVTSKHMEKSARVYLALRDFAEEHRYDALAVSCWARFQEVYGVAICAALSRLNNIGIVAPCEGDVLAAANMLIFNEMNGQYASLHDMVSLDESDQSINLWHCGVAPGCWADCHGVCWDQHFNIGAYEGERWHGDGVVADMRFKSGAVTICTMDSSFENLFVLSGTMTDEKPGFAGSSGWVRDLRLNGEPIELRDLLNTIAVMRVNHHYPAAYGDLTNQLNEFAAWMGMGVIEKVKYRPYLQSKRTAAVP